MAGRFFFEPACGKNAILCNSLKEQNIRLKLHVRMCKTCQDAQIVDCGSRCSKELGAYEADMVVRDFATNLKKSFS
jgi:hypothetical protein